VSPEALTQTELEVHVSLLELCRQAEVEMNAWGGAAPTQPQGSESTLGSILGRLMKRGDRGQFQEAMRRLYGLEL
jgi:hypothetical protein